MRAVNVLNPLASISRAVRFTFILSACVSALLCLLYFPCQPSEIVMGCFKSLSALFDNLKYMLSKHSLYSIVLIERSTIKHKKLCRIFHLSINSKLSLAYRLVTVILNNCYYWFYDNNYSSFIRLFEPFISSQTCLELFYWSINTLHVWELKYDCWCLRFRERKSCVCESAAWEGDHIEMTDIL